MYGMVLGLRVGDGEGQGGGKEGESGWCADN